MTVEFGTPARIRQEQPKLGPAIFQQCRPQPFKKSRSIPFELYLFCIIIILSVIKILFVTVGYKNRNPNKWIMQKHAFKYQRAMKS